MRSFFLFFSLSLINCNNSDTLELDINDKIILPKHYIVNKINDQINIDGKDDELAWSNAIYTSCNLELLQTCQFFFLKLQKQKLLIHQFFF